MASIGKKILSAFVEVKSAPGEAPGKTMTAETVETTASVPGETRDRGGNDRFREYFDSLFSEANIPGPDYYEFARMIDAMQSIANEQARFYAAYAGLQVQGLNKERLLATAGEYLRVLETDAGHFQATVDTALQEKVQGKAAELEEKSRRIEVLKEEIGRLQQEILTLQGVVKENQEKIEASTGGYRTESADRKARIQSDIEKIKHYIQ